MKPLLMLCDTMNRNLNGMDKCKWFPVSGGSELVEAPRSSYQQRKIQKRILRAGIEPATSRLQHPLQSRALPTELSKAYLYVLSSTYIVDCFTSVVDIVFD